MQASYEAAGFTRRTTPVKTGGFIIELQSRAEHRKSLEK